MTETPRREPAATDTFGILETARDSVLQKTRWNFGAVITRGQLEQLLPGLNIQGRILERELKVIDAPEFQPLLPAEIVSSVSKEFQDDLPVLARELLSLLIRPGAQGAPKHTGGAIDGAGAYSEHIWSALPFDPECIGVYLAEAQPHATSSATSEFAPLEKMARQAFIATCDVITPTDNNDELVNTLYEAGAGAIRTLADAAVNVLLTLDTTPGVVSARWRLAVAGNTLCDDWRMKELCSLILHKDTSQSKRAKP